jgi:hypothetical protein
MPDEPGGESTANLFGLPGAETMRDSIADVYESDIEPFIEWDSDPEWIVEEWTSVPARDFAPDPAVLAQQVAEAVADNMGAEEFDAFERAATAPDVIAMFGAAIGALVDRVGWRMAGTHVASYAISWTDEGVPLLNGQPLYGTMDPTVTEDAPRVRILQFNSPPMDTDPVWVDVEQEGPINHQGSNPPC